MKRMMITLFAIGMVAMSSTSMAMSTSRVRKETRFLTDKMAYELNLNTRQYNDAYEINFDFLYAVRNILDDVTRGEEWALDDYYYYLDLRNDDLRWVLNDWQYRSFMSREYFYRPIYADRGGWSFRIYLNYSNPTLFYFGLPVHYHTYTGSHCRVYSGDVSFYRGRYHHNVFVGVHSVRNDRVYYSHRRSDFGKVTFRSDSHRRPEHRNMDDLYSNRKGNSSRRNNVSVENRIRIEGANVTTGRTENDNSRRNENVRREDSRRIETENRERDNSRRHNAPEVRSNGSSIRFTPVKEVRSESSRRTIESRSDSRPSINEGRSEGVRSESSSSGRRANMNRPSAPSNVRTENSGRNNETRSISAPSNTRSESRSSAGNSSRRSSSDNERDSRSSRSERR